MSKKHTPARSSNAATSSSYGGFGSPSTFSPTASQLSYVNEPPDLSHVLDGNLVVLFKNLLKKDDTTKAKALEDLQNMLGGLSGIEEPVLAAWIRLYPRLSTDTSRRVRHLAHTAHGIVAQRAGKKLAKHMPKVVGAWLSGLYDNDRATARAARNALVLVFTTDEKVKDVWRHYHTNILEYCTNVIANESTGSLSDERQVSPDDAETKFARVIACCVLTVGHLISELPEADLARQDAVYGALFANPHFWAFTHHSDPFLRKALYKFLQLTLHKRIDLVSSNLETVANALLVKALATPQIGSVTDLLDALIDLTHVLPAAWTTATPPKKRAVITLIQRFVARGSQTAGPEYWSKLASLLSILPAQVLPTTPLAAKDLLHAIVEGIRNGPEPRSHLVTAWGSYFSTCYKLLPPAEDPDLTRHVLDDPDLMRHAIDDLDLACYVFDDAVYPIYAEYLLSEDPVSWTAIPHHAAVICANGIAMAGVQSERTVTLAGSQVWLPITDLVLYLVKTEGISVADLGPRWVELSAEILKRTRPENPVLEVVCAGNAAVLVGCVNSVVADNGTRSDVAGFLENMLTRIGDVMCAVEKVAWITARFFTNNILELLLSPSLPQLLGALVAYGIHTEATMVFQAAWKKIVQALLLSTLSKDRKEAAITQLLKSTHPSSGLMGKLPCVQELEYYVSKKLQASLETDEAAGWEMARAAFRSVAVSADTTMAMLVALTAGLTLTQEERAAKVCVQLGAVAKQDPAVLASFARSEHGADLLSRLLVLMENPEDAVSSAARTVNRALEQGLASSSTTKAQADRVVGDLVDIISKGVREPEDVELSLHTLAEKARDLINRAPEPERAGLAERLLFTGEHWRPALQPFLGRVRNVSLASTNAVGGCVFLVADDAAEAGPVVRDGQGVSSALRMGMFTVEFLKAVGAFEGSAGDIFSGVSEEARVNLFFYLTLTLEMAKDNVGIAGANDLWTGYSVEVEAEVEEFVSNAQLFIANCTKEGESAVYLAVDRLMEAAVQQTATGFYAARVLVSVIADLAEYQRTSAEQAQSWIKSVNVRKDTDVFRCTAILTGLAGGLEHSKDADRLRNELASDLTGVPAAKAGEEGLRKLIYLNAVLPNPGEEAVPLPTQRAIFLVKHLLAWFEDEEFAADPNLAVITEAAKVFASVLPAVKELYGGHWQTLCDFVVNCWQMCCVQMSEQDIPVVFATLKLFQTLRSLRTENDDIEDAWNNSTAPLYSGLIDLLRGSRQADEQHQPRNLCNALMARQTKTMDLKYLEGPSEIYPLLNVRSRSIQEAAFEILHRHIPSVQEQVSIDAAFSKEETFQLQLPAELLSLVLEPPIMGEVEGLSFARSMPLALRGYLLTWILIFDHFDNSSFRVKSAYVENLKEGGYLAGLFDFEFDFLGHAKGKPIDASKFQIEEYTLDSEENPEKDTQWLLIHLYYLSLRFTPSLAKSWWIDCKSRQKVLSVEKFTEKYMSPLIIDKELQSVRTWIQERPAPTAGEEDKEMQVKISRGAAKEVTAVYPIDDQTMEMVVRLPPTFPLRQVEVEGVKRVGLNEQQFRKMQLASQAVINFQSASIIDGLTLFHKNVQLHFDGVAECAICYSILAVTPDRALPNKACSTCKHKFHSTCLLKWFKSSNSSSCPLCRTSFSFYS